MEHLKMHSINKVDENINKIAALFPNCVIEAKNDNGEIVHKIDFDMLKQELSSTLVEGREERYQFTWPDKKQAILTANAPINKTLRPCREESVDFDNTENLYIEGDNLEVLKLLQETYLGKIKMIYIDPPYNTGNDFVYEDDFAQDAADYIANSGQTDEEGNRLVANTESNGRFHTDWLNMMYPRLKLARDLLSDDGVIFISIDDNEVENLKKQCNEIFGESNFVGLFFRKTKAGGGSASGSCAVEHDYVICYTKNDTEMKPLFEKFGDKYLARYKEKDEIGFYFWDTMERSSTATRPYTIKAPDGTLLSGKWFRSEETFKKDLQTGEVRFLKKKDGTWSVQFKQRLADGKKLRTIIDNEELTDKKYRSLSEELEDIVGCSLGHPPKPVSLMKILVYSVCSRLDTDIILDFFSGSATTAHAVMQLNAEDGGKRKFIMVQLPEITDEKSEAYKAGYKNICEIGKERIRRAGQQILKQVQNDKDSLFADEKKKLDIGFRVLKCDSSNMEDVYYTPDHFNAKELFKDNIKKDRTGEDLLFQTMLDLGIMLSSKIKTKKINGKEVFCVEGNYLMACFDDSVDEKTITEIAKEKPYYFVMRDPANSKDGDSLITNFEQIFTTYSPDTVRKVL